LAPKWHVNTKVDPSRLDPNLKVIKSQCDITIQSKLDFYVYYIRVLEIEILMKFKIISELAKTNEDEDVPVLPICLNWRNEANSFDSFVKKIFFFQKFG
jgi:hypothetical protein